MSTACHFGAPASVPRRDLLRRAASLATVGALAAASRPLFAASPHPRELSLVHTHTGERLQAVYAVGDSYLPDALRILDRFLRDHYTGDVGSIDPAVFDLLHRTQRALGCTTAFAVISGYRSPATNARLRARGGGVAKHSIHLEGRAIDVRLPGVPIADLRDAALSLRSGGVGFYPAEQFVHIDTGRVRSW
jgi:uncharacterized protein YcbK (DUF882 family)